MELLGRHGTEQKKEGIIKSKWSHVRIISYTYIKDK